MVESRTHNRKVASLRLGLAGIVGGGSECTALCPLSIPRRGALEQGTEPPTAPRRCSILQWLPTAPGVCSRCVCVHCCVCALGWVNADHEFWVWVTILGCMSLHFHKTYLIWSNILIIFSLKVKSIILTHTMYLTAASSESYLTAIRTYFTRWLIRMTSLVRFSMICLNPCDG